jgi:hypothetical protein
MAFRPAVTILPASGLEEYGPHLGSLMNFLHVLGAKAIMKSARRKARGYAVNLVNSAEGNVRAAILERLCKIAKSYY